MGWRYVGRGIRGREGKNYKQPMRQGGRVNMNKRIIELKMKNRKQKWKRMRRSAKKK